MQEVCQNCVALPWYCLIVCLIVAIIVSDNGIVEIDMKGNTMKYQIIGNWFTGDETIGASEIIADTPEEAWNLVEELSGKYPNAFVSYREIE